MNDITTFEIQDQVRKAAEPNFNYDFDFGKILSRAIDISKLNIGDWAIFNLVYTLVSTLIAITVIGWVALPALAFGYTYTVRKVMKGGKVEVGDMFKGFDHFGKLLSLGLILFCFFLILCLPFIIILAAMGIFANGMNEEAISALSGVLMLLYIPFILFLMVAQAMIIFAPHFAVYGNMSALDALKASFRFAKKKWLWWVVIVFVAGFLGGLGVYACIIGMFFTMHFKHVTISSAFFDIVDKNDGIAEKIEQTFI